MGKKFEGAGKMSIEKVRDYLEGFGAGDRIIEFPESSATVELAAHAAGVIPARIAKSITFQDGDGCLMLVTAGDTKIDNRKFKDTFHFKAKMLSPEQTLAFTGHAVGGVCPFALPEGVKVFLDSSLRRFDTVFPAAGSSNSAIQLTMQQLEEYCCNFSGWVEVCAVREPKE